MKRDIIECDQCGLEMWDNEQGHREMKLHEAECSGMTSPHERFDVGDLVEYSDFGRERLNVDQRAGKIIGFSNQDYGVRVQWNDRKTPARYAHTFIIARDA